MDETFDFEDFQVATVGAEAPDDSELVNVVNPSSDNGLSFVADE